MIVVTIIFIFVAVLMHTILYYTYKGLAEYRNGMLFAILLPEGVLNDPEIQAIQKRFLRDMRTFNWVVFISYFPFVIAFQSIAIQITYLFVWMVAIFFGVLRPFRRASAATISLKQEHEWYVRPQQMVNGQFVYDDGDQYWSNGITYHNPNDTKVLVPKRIGIGETVNTATKTGKTIIYTTMIVVAITVIGTLLLVVSSEINSPQLQFPTNTTVHIDYPGYSYQFSTADIISLSLIEQYPKALKTSGFATNDYLRGNFRIRDVGKLKMYIYRESPPYIEIKLEDIIIYYNDDDPEQTIMNYEEMVAMKQR